jgi:hypothetical protein
VSWGDQGLLIQDSGGQASLVRIFVALRFGGHASPTHTVITVAFARRRSRIAQARARLGFSGHERSLLHASGQASLVREFVEAFAGQSRSSIVFGFAKEKWRYVMVFL